MTEAGEERLRQRIAEAEAEIARLRQSAVRSSRDYGAEHIIAEIAGVDDKTDPFAAAVRATRMPMVISNPRLPDNPIVFVNDSFCRLTGYPREEIVGRNCRFLQGPETDPATVNRIREAVRARRPIEVDIRNHRKTGEPFWNRLLMAPVRDADGVLTYFFASQVDVTLERERLAGLEYQNAALMAELSDRLRTQEDSEARLRFATQAGRLGIWELDLSSGELNASDAFKAAFGRDPASLFTHAEVGAAIHPEDRDRMERAVAESVATGADYHIEYRVLHPGGTLGWVDVRAQVLRSPEGTPLRLAGTCLDITDRKRAEARDRALIELDDRFRILDDPADLAYAASEMLGRMLEVSRAGYGTVDPVAETVTIERDWNAPGIRSLAGTLQFRDYGSYVDDLKRGDTVVCTDADLDPRTAAMAGALRGISAQAFVNMPVTEQDSAVALLYLNHATVRAWPAEEMAFVREVAQRTRMAVQRRRAEHDLRALAATLEVQVASRTEQLMEAEAALRQSQKMEAVGQLTGGVAHDFNNLLTVIRSSTDLLKRPDLPEERRARYVGAISDTVERAARLTGQLLAFARRQALRPEVFDAGQSLRQLTDMMNTLTGSRIRIATEMPDAPCFIDADPSQFDTAIINMAVNARDAMGGQGRLTVAVRRVGEMPVIRAHAAVTAPFVAVSLTDTGAGIPAEALERIFEPFFTTKSVGKGTGLGLSQVYGFAKQSGGEVMVASRVGEGTTFTLYLPEVAAPAAAAETGEPEPLMDGHGTRVLVVEDNPDVGGFATQTLAELGYVTVWSRDAEQALAELAGDADGFDIVFSDVVMPGMDGIQLGREIRRLHPALPVVLTSGYSHVLAENGTSGFELLHKPYSIEELSRVLRKAATWQRRRRVLAG